MIMAMPAMPMLAMTVTTVIFHEAPTVCQVLPTIDSPAFHNPSEKRAAPSCRGGEQPACHSVFTDLG